MGRHVLRPLAVAVSIVAGLQAQTAAGGPPRDEPYSNSRPLSFWVQALTVHEPARRIEAAQSVAEIAIAHGGTAVSSAVPGLLAGLADEDPDVRQSAAHALEQIGPPARAAVPALVQMMSADAEPGARRGAGLALGRIDAASAEVVAQAGRSLADPDPGVRVSAAVLLMSSGPGALTVGEALTRALQDENPTVRIYAAAAVGRAGDQRRAAPLVLAGLSSSDAGVRAESAALLPDFARTSPEVVSALATALQDEESLVRVAAADALGVIGRPARPALDALWAHLRDPDETVREAVLRAAKIIKDAK